jgi:hypothetical protein
MIRPPRRLLVALASFFMWSVSCCAIAAGNTVIGIDGSQFTLNGKPTFLLGISYYGALGASQEFVRRDLDDVEQYGFNWLRVWATWESFGEDVSAVDSAGRPRPPYMDALKRLVADCDRRGLVVDVTLTRGKRKATGDSPGRIPDFESHARAVESVMTALKPHRNWYLDLANERDVRDDRFVAVAELKKLREIMRRLDPSRLATASFGGHDLNERDIRDALVEAELDFLSPHRPRDPESPAQTEARTRECLAQMKQIGRVAPILYQEPFRRGYAAWEPTAEDFLTDFRGAVAGEAAGWCFHNGSQRSSADGQPRRSFDLRAKRLFDQLDPDELEVMAKAAGLMRPVQKP